MKKHSLRCCAVIDFPDFAMVRSLKLKNSRRWIIRQTNPRPPDELTDGVDSVGERLGVIRLDRCSDGLPKAASPFAKTLIAVYAGGCLHSFTVRAVMNPSNAVWRRNGRI